MGIVKTEDLRFKAARGGRKILLPVSLSKSGHLKNLINTRLHGNHHKLITASTYLINQTLPDTIGNFGDDQYRG